MSRVHVSMFVATLFLLAFLSASEEVLAQPRYWLALNFRLTFYGNGTVLVEELMHPFTPDGRSLLEDKEVEADLRNSTTELLRYVLLMFSEHPEKILYRIGLVLDKRYGESVYCDVLGTGSMMKFLGAYVLTVHVYLNTSTFVEDLGEGSYRISVRDSFTSTDPRSWIDVVAFSFKDGATLLGVNWTPAYAQPPLEEDNGALLWINTNELEAPDFYIFTVKLPAFRYAGIPPEVKAVILSARLEGGKAIILVSNTGTSSGYVLVWLRGEGVDQARKVFLNPRDRLEVVFPDVPPGNHTVTLISGTSILDEKPLTEQVGEAVSLAPQWQLLMLAVLAAAVIFTLAFLRARARSRQSLHQYFPLFTLES